MVARVLFIALTIWGNTSTSPPRGRRKRPNPASSSTPAPTGVDESSSSGFHLGETLPHPAGDHKGPPSPASASLAPTDVDGGVLTSITWLSTIILNLR